MKTTITIVVLFALIATLASALRVRSQQTAQTGSDPLATYDGEIVYLQSTKSGYGGKYLGTRNRRGERRCAFRDEHVDQLIGNADRKWKVRYATGTNSDYFVLENVGRSGHYMKSTGPNKAIKIRENTYPEGNNEFLWKADGTESSFSIYNKRYGKYMYVQGDDDLELTSNSGNKYKLYTPPIAEFNDVVAIIDNTEDVQYTYTITVTVGISTTTSASITITNQISAEVQYGFAKASISSTISNTWTISNTYSVAETHTHSVVLGKGRWEVRQLKATYGPLTVGSNSYGLYKTQSY